MKSAGNGSVLKGRLHVLLAAGHRPASIGIAAREAPYHTGASPDLPVQLFNDIIGADAGSVFAGKIAVGRCFLNAVLHLHGAQFLHHRPGLLTGSFLEHLSHQLHLGARRNGEHIAVEVTIHCWYLALGNTPMASSSSMLPHISSLRCPLITSSFSCTIFSDMVCCLLSNG